jgi:hypothetical protein
MKFIKGCYLRNIKKRMQLVRKVNIEIKKEYLQKNYEDFNMKWFEKVKIKSQQRKEIKLQTPHHKLLFF